MKFLFIATDPTKNEYVIRMNNERSFVCDFEPVEDPYSGREITGIRYSNIYYAKIFRSKYDAERFIDQIIINCLNFYPQCKITDCKNCVVRANFEIRERSDFLPKGGIKKENN